MFLRSKSRSAIRGLYARHEHTLKDRIATVQENIQAAVSTFQTGYHLLDNIISISQNTLKDRIELPEELVRRIASITQKRTHSQLEALKPIYVHDEGNRRQFPRDTHKYPIGWIEDSANQIPAYVYGPKETIAYVAYQIEKSYAAVYHTLTQLKQKSNFIPTRMLDFGSGPGTASYCAKQVYGDSIERYQIVEPSQAMVDAAQIILKDFNGLSIRRSLSELRKEIFAGSQYDLIIISHVLSEIPNDLERIKIVSALYELLTDNGVIVMVDRGSPWGSHQIRSARQFILDSVRHTNDNVRIIAPCPHQNQCPLKNGNWCHFVQRSPAVFRPREQAPRRWHGHSGSKFSYVIFQKNQIPNQNDSVSRMIRAPLVLKRHVILDLCTPNGEIERRKVTKGNNVREAYRAAKKAHWGAEWPTDPNVYRDLK